MSQKDAIRFLVALALMVSGCSKAVFSSANSSFGELRWQDGDRKFYSTSQVISSTQVRPLDIIWVVDNSGSMNTEAAHVRANLSSFVQQLASATDVRIALISRLGNSGTATKLPTTSIPSLEIGLDINSVDALVALASTICPVDNPTPECATLGTKYSATRGQLRPFLRSNSQKILVVVTDDESSISQVNFKKIYDSLYPPQSLSVFGWVGLGSTLSPCQARTGLVYLDLAAQTGGETYNVCDTDWSPHFSQLANNVVTLAQDTVNLPPDVLAGQFLKVIINGREIESKDYTKTSTGIVLSPAVRQGLTRVDVTIEYR